MLIPVVLHGQLVDYIDPDAFHHEASQCLIWIDLTLSDTGCGVPDPNDRIRHGTRTGFRLQRAYQRALQLQTIAS